MKRMLLVLLAVVFVSAGYGWAGQPLAKDSGDVFVLTSADNGKSVTVRPGKLILARLPGNPDTGFIWQVASVVGDAVKARGEAEFEPPPPSNPTGSGTFVLKFRAAKAGGDSTIRLIYLRPAETDKPPAKVFTAAIRVR